jgi:hypothetical protein
MSPGRRSSEQRLPRPALPLLLAASSILAASCVQNQAQQVRKDEREEIAVWDFPIELPKNTVHLWPPAVGSPLRSKRHLDTRTEPARLFATVTGDDPYFIWQLETPIQAFGVHVRVDADAEGPLQLFWSTPACPVFSETCSATVSLARGSQAVEFLLDSHDPLRELRLDLPEHVGAKMAFDEITLLRSAELEQSWAPNQSVAETTATSTGLFLDANAPDPWITTLIPGADPARITAAELVLRGGDVPRLYWADAPSAFQEISSVSFESVDAGGELTHRAKLRGQPGWTGRVRTLRFDPGPGAGRYVLERFALVHDPADSRSQ